MTVETAPQASVIIPTRDRLAALVETLESLAQQTLLEACEVIVVDDGSRDGTPAQVAQLELPFPLAVVEQPNRGAAAARNRGAAQAQGAILIFLDADMITAPNWLAEHLQSHAEHPHALVAGRRAPWEAARTSRFSQVIDLDSNVRAGRPFTFQEAFSANLSIHATDFAALEGFDETFPASGCEDIDFAYRARQHGCSLVYNPEALGCHNHPTDLSRACRQAHAYHCSMALLLRKHPELRGEIEYLGDKYPIDWKQDPAGLVLRKMARQGLATRPALWLMQQLVVPLERAPSATPLLRSLYCKILGSYQLRGLREGIQRHGR